MTRLSTKLIVAVVVTMSVLLQAGASSAQSGQATDLTGLWKSDTSIEIYRVRQIENRFYWMVDGTPQRGYANVFIGLISGTTITGYWVNMPGSPNLDTRPATLVLKIESNDRFVKQSETGYVYNSNVWTRIREGGTPPTPAPSPTPAPPPAAAPPAGPPPDSGGELTWGDRTMEKFRGQNGKRITFSCPRNSNPQEWMGVYGTDVYTDDSNICSAAVHAGVITFDGGTFTVEIGPGQSSYRGTPKRNGVTSADYAKWDGSFSFVRNASSSFDIANRPMVLGGAAAEVIEGGTIAWTARGLANAYRGKNGTRVRYSCPAGGTSSAWIWGTDTYTDDSTICQAAVHAGVITFARGGTFIIEIRPGLSAYTGSTRNGVTTANFEAYVGSFVFVR